MIRVHAFNRYHNYNNQINAYALFGQSELYGLLC